MLVEQQVMVTLIILDPNGTDLYAMLHALFGKGPTTKFA